MSAPKTCVICSGSLVGNKRSKEHVVPDWLQTEFGIGRSVNEWQILGSPDVVFGAYVNRPGPPAVVKSVRRHDYQGLLAGNICGTCNTGWMHRLEEATKPVLRKLISDPFAADVTPEEWFTLVAWSLKTAFTFEQSNPAGMELIPPIHLRLLAEGRLPDGVALFLSKSTIGRPEVSFWVSRDWLTTTDRETTDVEMGEFVRQTYKATIHFRQLVMTLVYVPPASSWRLSIWPELHRLVYNAGVQIDDSVPWLMPPPPGTEIGLLAPASLLLSLGRFAVSGKKVPLRFFGETIIDVHEHEVDVLGIVGRRLNPAPKS